MFINFNNLYCMFHLDSITFWNYLHSFRNNLEQNFLISWDFLLPHLSFFQIFLFIVSLAPVLSFTLTKDSKNLAQSPIFYLHPLKLNHILLLPSIYSFYGIMVLRILDWSQLILKILPLPIIFCRFYSMKYLNYYEK